jgi:hypothetical protein
MRCIQGEFIDVGYSFSRTDQRRRAIIFVCFAIKYKASYARNSGARGQFASKFGTADPIELLLARLTLGSPRCDSRSISCDGLETEHEHHGRDQDGQAAGD